MTSKFIAVVLTYSNYRTIFDWIALPVLSILQCNTLNLYFPPFYCFSKILFSTVNVILHLTWVWNLFTLFQISYFKTLDPELHCKPSSMFAWCIRFRFHYVAYTCNRLLGNDDAELDPCSIMLCTLRSIPVSFILM